MFMSSQIFLQGITLEQLAEALKPLVQSNAPIQQTTTEDDFIDRKTASKLLSVNLTTLNKHTKSGKLKSYAIGNRILYKRSEVLAAIKPINY